MRDWGFNLRDGAIVLPQYILLAYFKSYVESNLSIEVTREKIDSGEITR